MANKRRADPVARPARRLRNGEPLHPTVPSTETVIRLYLHPPLLLLLLIPLTDNVIAGGSFARTIEGVAIGFVFGREYSSGTPRPS